MANDLDKPSPVDVTTIPCAPVIIFQKAMEEMQITAQRLAKKIDQQLEAKTTKVLVIGGEVVKVEVDDNASQLDALKQAMKAMQYMPNDKLDVRDEQHITVEIAQFKPKVEQVSVKQIEQGDTDEE